MGRSLVISDYGNGSTSTANTIQYWNVVGTTDPSTSETPHRIPFRTPGTFSKLTVNTYLGNTTSGGNTVCNLRKNGADANQTVVIPASTTGIFTDTTNTDTIAAGDQLCLKTDPPSSGTFGITNITMLFESTDEDVTDSRLFMGNPASNNASVVYYSVISGMIHNSVTVTTDQRLAPKVAGDFKYWAGYSSAGGRAWAIRLMKGGTDDVVNRLLQNANITGLLEDTSDTITINSSDDINHLHVYGGSGTARTINWFGLSFITSTKHSLYVCGRPIGNVRNFGNLDYLNLSGSMISGATENLFQTKCLSDFEFSNMQVRVKANTINSGNTTLLFRKNGADTSLGVTIPAGNTGLFTDTTDTVIVDEDDLVDYECDISGTSGQLTLTYIAVLAEDKFVDTGEPGPPVEATVTSKTVTNKFITIAA